MEEWFRDMFHTTYAPDTNPAYDHIMDPITAQELHYRIKCLCLAYAGFTISGKAGNLL